MGMTSRLGRSIVGTLALALVLGHTREGEAQTVLILPAEQPRHLAVGDQYYEANLRGFREYLDSLYTSDPELYAKLDPELAKLEKRSKTATTLLIVGGVVALASIAVPVAAANSCDSASAYHTSDPEYRAAVEDDLDCGDRVTAGTVAVVSAGFGIAFVGLAVFPTRRAKLQFLNLHNRLRPETPAKLEVGFVPHRRLAGATLVFRY